eukprot:scaffold92278_cov62-Phaeocystis_antarctica.AAC.2
MSKLVSKLVYLHDRPAMHRWLRCSVAPRRAPSASSTSLARGPTRRTAYRRHLAALRLPAALPRPEGGVPQGVMRGARVHALHRAARRAPLRAPAGPRAVGDAGASDAAAAARPRSRHRRRRRQHYRGERQRHHRRCGLPAPRRAGHLQARTYLSELVRRLQGLASRRRAAC